LIQSHHYLGALPKIGNSLWYIATWEDEWPVLLSFSTAALKCGARDCWIGWDFHHQYNRLNLIVNNSRFLILPRHHHQNLASKVLSLCQRRINSEGTGSPSWSEGIQKTPFTLNKVLHPRDGKGDHTF
jgi:hypothetical protein